MAFDSTVETSANSASLTNAAFELDSTTDDVFETVYDASEMIESNIPDNSHFMCTATIPVSKQGRDYAMFGAYTAKLGVRAYKTDNVTPYVTLGEHEFSYMLEEPEYAEMEYDEDDTTTADDFIWNHLLEKEMKLNVTKALNDASATGKAQQRLYAGFLVNPNYGVDDLIEMHFELDLPEQLLETGMIVQ